MYEEEIKFIEEYEDKVVELTKNANLAFFNASISENLKTIKLRPNFKSSLTKLTPTVLLLLNWRSLRKEK